MAAVDIAIAEVRVPDIGDFKDIPVIEVLVQPGSKISPTDSVATLESDKATLDIPAQVAGRVVSVEVTPGTRVSCGTLLLRVAPESGEANVLARGALESASDNRPADSRPFNAETSTATAIAPMPTIARREQKIYAGPSIRRMARELTIDLDDVTGTGPRGRIVRTDLIEWLKGRAKPAEMGTAAASHGDPPSIDFTKFGEIERTPLKRVSRISGEILARTWRTIPHVTNFEDADVTDLDAFRTEANEAGWATTKLTLTAFVVKACAGALLQIPQLNVSLDGSDLIQKKYVHIGVAVDAKDGLIVPVIRDADKATVGDIATRLRDSVELARSGKLKSQDMQGGSMTISSLGSTGGRHFTPIINAPEVAIVGLGKTRIEPRWRGDQFLPRQILPISLSWDHRALDGVTAARFLMQLIAYLQDFRRLLL